MADPRPAACNGPAAAIRPSWGAGGLAALVLALLALATPAAGAAAPAWRIDALGNSTAAPGGTLTYLIELKNVGDADANGSLEPISLSGTLPAGLTILAGPGSPWDCSTLVVGAQTFTCESTRTFAAQATNALFSYETVKVQVAVDPAASGVLTSRFEVAGGDPSDADPSAPSASTVAPATITPDAPAFGLAAFDAQVTDASGMPFTQAGGHPFAATTFIDFNTFRHPDPLKGDLTPVEAVKDIFVDLPPGFFGDPHGAGQCSLSQLANASGTLSEPLCPATSQVGTTFVRTNGFHLMFGPIPVFNMNPPVDAPARLGFNALGTVVTLDVSVRSDTDYGLTAHLRNISEGLAIAGSTLTLWGVPADPVHDPERACPGERAPWDTGPSCSSGASQTAFLRNPTSCPAAAGMGLPTTLRMDSWAHPGTFVEQTIFSHLPNGYPFPPDQWGAQQGTTDCDSVPFDPSFDVAPASSRAGEPTSFSFDVSLPQTSDPDTIGQSDLRKAVVTLPLGVHLSASSTDGLEGCSLAQVGLHSTADSACPPGSKIGVVSITTPALPDPLEGSVYLARPHDNPFDTLTALYLVARGSGVTVKLPARVDLDPLTGQITTTIDNAPQTPFSNVHIELKGGPWAPLANPLVCGTYTAHAQLTSWSGKSVGVDSRFAITQAGSGAPCAGTRFSPGFSAGTESSVAGSSSPFRLRLTREDTDQELGGLRLNMPRGLAGYISKVKLCGAAKAAAGTCPEASRIGTVVVGAGSGTDPFYITNGRLYLTGPYNGAPFGLSVVVPAVAGPFNLGNVVVRQAIYVGKHTARLRIVSDPLPTILQGVTLGVRDVRVAIDKPRFFRNPTSCAVKRIRATLTSVQDRVAKASTRFQAAECASLRFKPRMVLRVGGSGHTRRGQASALATTLRMPRHSANLRFVKVVLPKTINARLNTINDACTRAEFESDIASCAHARAGTARAVTPLLRHALKGNVYFVKNGHPIPDLFVALRGQVAFDLIGRITIPGGTRLATTFKAAPDVPVRSFSLRLLGGPHTASIGAAANLCSPASRRQKARVLFIGQNGTVRQVAQPLRIAGCKTKHRAGHGR